MEKKCLRCKEEFPLSDFWLASNTKDGRKGVCKNCISERRKLRYWKEGGRERQKLYYAKRGRILYRVRANEAGHKPRDKNNHIREKEKEEAEIDRKLKELFGT